MKNTFTCIDINRSIFIKKLRHTTLHSTIQSNMLPINGKHKQPFLDINMMYMMFNKHYAIESTVFSDYNLVCRFLRPPSLSSMTSTRTQCYTRLAWKLYSFIEAIIYIPHGVTMAVSYFMIV